MTLSTWLRKNSLPTFFEDEFGFKNSNSFSPKADIVEKEREYLVSLELPGVKKEHVDVTVKDNVLTIKGEKKVESKEEKENYYSFETSYGRFERSWVINDIDESKIAADLKDGILKIVLPKKEEVVKKAETKKIDVQ